MVRAGISLMKIAIFGDVHAEWSKLNFTLFKALNKHPDITHFVQVGDLGYAWPRTKPFEIDRRMANTMVVDASDKVFERAKQIPFYFLEGNHENFTILDMDKGASQPGMIYQPRGSTVDFGYPLGRSMFFGGASSIDKHHRIEGISWWPQESITEEQVLLGLSQKGPIDIMFSHEFPAPFEYSTWKDDFGIADRIALERVRSQFNPKFYVFGHHHNFAEGEYDGTKWMCTNIIDDLTYIIYDGYDLKHEI